MEVSEIEKIFEKISDTKKWTVSVLQITNSKREGISYLAREIVLSNNDIEEQIGDIRNSQVGTKGIIKKYHSVEEYDGSASSDVIYHLSSSNSLIKDEYGLLVNAIANADHEMDPNLMKLRACVYRGSINLSGDDKMVYMISLQNPITTLKHKYLCNKGRYKKITENVLQLRPQIDVLFVDNDIYFMNMVGENLFNMERSYKKLCIEYTAVIEESNIIIGIDMFKQTAQSGANPRRFVSYDHKRLEKLQSNKRTREKIAKQFNIPVTEGNLDVSLAENSEKLVKLLCKKGMTDPFEDSAVEVPSAKKWV